MSERESTGEGRLGFLDSLGRLFRGKREAESDQATPESDFDKLEAGFAAAIRGLNERIEAQRGAGEGAAAAAGGRASAEQREAERKRRQLATYQAMRGDVEKMHEALRTGISGADLDALGDFLGELADLAEAGRDSQELIPRARFAIAQRLRAEAGALAVARLIAALESEGKEWPDPTRPDSKETPERIERSRRRRLLEVREGFLAQDLRRTAERLHGVVRGWGSDYPDRGTPLWEETVLEAVAAGLRARLIRDAVEALRKDRELLLSKTEAAVGPQLAALNAAVEEGIHSVAQARQAVASALRVLDDLVPQIAWEIVQSRVPEARGETSHS